MLNREIPVTKKNGAFQSTAKRLQPESRHAKSGMAVTKSDTTYLPDAAHINPLLNTASILRLATLGTSNVKLHCRALTQYICSVKLRQESQIAALRKCAARHCACTLLQRSLVARYSFALLLYLATLMLPTIRSFVLW